MAVYEYYCDTCHERFELRQSMSSMATEVACPEGHRGARKVLSVFATVTSGGAAAADASCMADMGGCGTPSCCMN